MRVVFLFLICGLLVCACAPDALQNDDLIGYAPRKASVVIKVDDLKDYNNAISENEFLQKLNGTALTEFFTAHRPISNEIDARGTTIISYVKLGKGEYDISVITKHHPQIHAIDSTKTTAITPTINRIATDDGEYFTAQINTIYITSTSKLLIENAQRQAAASTAVAENFKKAYTTASSFADASVIIKGEDAPELFRYIFPNSEERPLRNSLDYMVVDLDISNVSIAMNGVILTDAKKDHKLSFYNGTSPARNTFSTITPSTAVRVTAVSVEDINTMRENVIRNTSQTLADFNTVQDSLLTTFDEVALITLKKGEALAAHSSDPEATKNYIAGAIKANTFRQVQLYTMDQGDFKKLGSAFTKAFPNLQLDIAPTMFCQLDDFYIFAATQESLEAIIANYQNKSTLALHTPYTNANASLSSAATYSSVWSLSAERLREVLSEKDAKKLKDVSINNYPYALIQAVQDDGFMHFNGVLGKNEVINEQGAIAQVASIKLATDIAAPPQLVKNHRTKGTDIVVQDLDNTLYLISNSGKVLWQKPLSNRILGMIEQVDLYNNGRLQLAFTTADGFYIVDRDGNDVAPFPLKKEKDLTVPAAIFNYDGTSNYRFLLVQHDKVTMYDKRGKVVNGFTFNKAGSAVLHTPQHIRIANKDYITVTEAGGKLRILNRVGKDRVTVDQRIDFGDTNITRLGNLFTTYDANGNRITIATNGAFTKEETPLAPPFKLDIKDKTTATLVQNKLTINGKLYTLDYGSYTAPRIFTVDRTVYVSVTNRDTSEVYLFDSNATLLPKFPIYGTSTIDLAHLERNSNLGFVTQGDAKTILIYQMN